MIDDVGQMLAEALQQFVAGKAALGGELFNLVGAERVGEIAGRDLLVGAVADPGVSLIAKALLLELIEEVAEAAAQDAPRRAAREQSAQAALEHVAQSATARAAAGQAGIDIAGRGRRLRRRAGLVAAEMLDAFPGQERQDRHGQGRHPAAVIPRAGGARAARAVLHAVEYVE